MKTLKLLTTVSIIFLLSCSQPTKEARLQELIEQRKEIDIEIETLKKDLAAQGKDANQTMLSTPVKILEIEPITFKHFIEIQGNVETDNNILIPPEKPGIVKAIYVDKGIEIATKRALSTPIKNISTSTTTRNPRIIVLKRLARVSRVI